MFKMLFLLIQNGKWKIKCFWQSQWVFLLLSESDYKFLRLKLFLQS